MKYKLKMEEVINFWDNNICNLKHSSKEIGTKEYFQEVSKKKYYVENHIQEFAQFDKYKNKKVLEVGCGLGTAMQSFIEAGADYKGIDVSKKSLEIAKKRLEVFDLDGKIEEADIQIYKDDEKYDLIYSFGVLHHIPDIKLGLKNIREMMKDDGEFKLMLYATNSWKKFRINEGLDQYEANSGVPIAYDFTKEEVLELLKNFSNIRINQTHIFPYKIPEYKEGRYVKEDYFEAMDEKLFNCLEKNLGWHLCITCNK